jgi:hypothetical protein
MVGQHALAKTKKKASSGGFWGGLKKFGARFWNGVKTVWNNVASPLINSSIGTTIQAATGIPLKQIGALGDVILKDNNNSSRYNRTRRVPSTAYVEEIDDDDGGQPSYIPQQYYNDRKPRLRALPESPESIDDVLDIEEMD